MAQKVNYFAFSTFIIYIYIYIQTTYFYTKEFENEDFIYDSSRHYIL